MNDNSESDVINRVNRKGRVIKSEEDSESEIIERINRRGRVVIREEDSESEMIKRSKRKYKEENEEDDEEDDEEICLNPFFVEIFGTGHEYDYIYENIEQPREEEEKQVNEDKKGCYDYVKRRLPPFGFFGITNEIISKLEKGISAEVIGYHEDGLNIIEAYYIKDLIQLYRQYSMNEKSNICNMNDIPVKGFLSISQFIENIRCGERIHQPSVFEDIKPNTTNIIKQISNNEIFKEFVERYCEFEIMAKHYGTEFDSHKLFRYFLSENDDSGNVIREAVINEAYYRVRINKMDIIERLNRNGFIEDSKTGLRGLVELLISVRGQMNVEYAGILCGSRYCWVVAVDKYGEDLRSGAYWRDDWEGIKKCIGNSNVVCITSLISQTTALRHFLRGIGRSVFYVPLRLAILSDNKEYSIAREIVLLVQNPLVYFSRYVYKNMNNRSIKYNKNSISDNKTNIFDISIETIERGIRIVLGAFKLDWIETLKYKQSYGLFAILGIKLDNDYFDYSGIHQLNDLRQVFSEIEFNNICGYFTLSNSVNPLDITHVHPKDYSIAELICLGLKGDNNAFNDTNTIINNISTVKWALNNPTLILGMKIPEEDKYFLERIRDQLIYISKDWFCGASDKQIFEEIIPFKQSGQANGYVIWANNGFAFIDCGHGVIVNVRGNFSIGKEVIVNIGKPIYEKLYYSGYILSDYNENFNNTDDYYNNKTNNTNLQKILESHKLFRLLDQLSIETCMDIENKNVLIRLSEKLNYCVVVCRIQPNLFWKFPLYFSIGIRENSFQYGERKFLSLDDFIENYIKPLFKLIFNVSRFKYFYSSLQEARSYVRYNNSKYIRYAITFSILHSGYIEFHYSNKSILALLDSTRIVYRNYNFNTLEEFINYTKKIFQE